MEMQLHDAVVFAAPLAASAVTLTALHWFPWHGGLAPLRRTTAYVLGTLVTVGIPVATMLLTAALGLVYGQAFWAALLVANTAVSGATVHVAYWIDGHRALTLEDGHAAARE